jgi:Spy/CpxP family protein refolding chaperone
MNRIRLVAIGTILILTSIAVAQQTTTTSADSTAVSAAQPSVPTPEAQLKILTGKLDLTSDQEDKIKSILQDLYDATMKIVQDKTLSHEERLAKVRPHRYAADKRIREILNDAQKRKLDLYEQGPHSEMHGDLSGANASVSPQR